MQIKAVVTHHADLIKKIANDKNVIENSMSALPVFIHNTTASEESSSALNADYMYFQLLVQVFTRMKRNSEALTELVNLCKQQYEGNPGEIALINEFDRTYSAGKVLWWYTRESFIYRLLNKALRTHNIDVLCLFYFVTGDLYRQLLKIQRHYYQQHWHEDGRFIRVFRGQGLAQEELQKLQANVGKSMSLNSFLSTSRDRKVSVSFAKNTLNGFLPVLFDILVNNRAGGESKPFADISEFSYFHEEQEVLFMLGSIFQITNVSFDYEENIWIIKLSLTNDDHHIFKPTFLREIENLPKEPHFESVAKVLNYMGREDKAEHYYKKAEQHFTQLINNELTDSATLANCYSGLAWIARVKGQHEAEADYYLKAHNLHPESVAHLETRIAIMMIGDNIFL